MERELIFFGSKAFFGPLLFAALACLDAWFSLWLRGVMFLPSFGRSFAIKRSVFLRMALDIQVWVLEVGRCMKRALVLSYISYGAGLWLVVIL